MRKKMNKMTNILKPISTVAVLGSLAATISPLGSAMNSIGEITGNSLNGISNIPISLPSPDSIMSNFTNAISSPINSLGFNLPTIPTNLTNILSSAPTDIFRLVAIGVLVYVAIMMFSIFSKSWEV
jgi:hypothetical protein